MPSANKYLDPIAENEKEELEDVLALGYLLCKIFLGDHQSKSFVQISDLEWGFLFTVYMDQPKYQHNVPNVRGR